jgi:tetratricopeptide (TPR) repeat protein
LYLGLGYVYLKLGSFQRAITLFKASASINPMAIDAFVDAGNTFFTMAMYLSDSTNNYSTMMPFINYNGINNNNNSTKSDTSFQSLLQQALHCYQRALRINPTNVSIRLNLAALFRVRKDDINAVM